MSNKILMVDGYDYDGWKSLNDCDCIDAFKHYAETLKSISSSPIEIMTIHPGKKEEYLPQGISLKDFNGIEFGSISDEHLTLDITNSDAKQLNVGDKIEIIPGHNDTTVNLHTDFFGIRNDILESIWPISARAKIR